jgi:hypothetical protein
VEAVKKKSLPFVAALVALLAVHAAVAVWCWKAPAGVNVLATLKR